MSLQITFKFPLVNGLHARPASFLQQYAKNFNAIINLVNHKNNTMVDVKSAIALMSSNTMFNDECELIFDGGDAVEAYNWFNTYITDVFPFVDEVTPILESQQQKTLPRILKNYTGNLYTGKNVVKGVNIAKLQMLNNDVWNKIDDLPYFVDNKIRFSNAVQSLKARLVSERSTALDSNVKTILEAHYSLLDDEEFIQNITSKMTNELSIAKAMHSAYLHYQNIFAGSTNLYLQQRVIDIQDLIIQLINIIYDNVIDTTIKLSEPTIIMTKELTPSVFLSLDKNLLKGLVLFSASSTSHTAILARSFDIPTVSDIDGFEDINFNVLGDNKSCCIIDGNRGLVLLNPSNEIINYYTIEVKEAYTFQKQNLEYSNLEPVTLDNHRVELVANVATNVEVERAITYGALGVGLFRSEFIFMDRHSAPTEDEQFAIYQDALIKANGLPVIVRLLDIGGDKPLDYLNIAKEENPFLGYRAVRFYPEYIEIFKTQVKALLRASFYGNLWIMVPMIATATEMQWVQNEVLILKNELLAKNIQINSNIPLGTMIEVPSTAFAIEDIAKSTDFFSIGTNDLAQYFFAAERGNHKVSHLANVMHPAFIRLLQQIVSKCNQLKKFVGMCGEMAGDIDCLPLLVGLGLNELSMSIPVIPSIKYNLSKLNYTKCCELVLEACKCSTSTQVKQLLDVFNAVNINQEQKLLSDSLILLDSNADSKHLAIKEVVSLLKGSGRTNTMDEIEESLWLREDTYATGIGYGVAIPHCKTSVVSHSSVCLIKLNNPIAWGSIDNEPVRFIISLIIKEDNGGDNTHLLLIAKLSRNLMKEDFRNSLFNCKTSTEILELLNFLNN